MTLKETVDAEVLYGNSMKPCSKLTLLSLTSQRHKSEKLGEIQVLFEEAKALGPRLRWGNHISDLVHNGTGILECFSFEQAHHSRELGSKQTAHELSVIREKPGGREKDPPAKRPGHLDVRECSDEERLHDLLERVPLLSA